MAVDRATLARTAQEGKRIEKIGKLEEGREMREYRLCLLITNPEFDQTQNPGELVVKMDCLV